MLAGARLSARKCSSDQHQCLCGFRHDRFYSAATLPAGRPGSKTTIHTCTRVPTRIPYAHTRIPYAHDDADVYKRSRTRTQAYRQARRNVRKERRAELKKVGPAPFQTAFEHSALLYRGVNLLLLLLARACKQTHAHAHARARTHARTHARMHIYTCVHMHA